MIGNKHTIFMVKRIKHILKKNQFEHLAWNTNQFVCGIDEAGRGSFAGPVVAAAVVLPKDIAPDFLQDSKKMTEKNRIKAFSWIQEHCHVGVGIVHHRYIDQHNIVKATIYAMKRALLQLHETSDKQIASIIVDAVHLKTDDCHFSQPIYAFPFGESFSSSIAAASIVAKITRDSLMQFLCPLFPYYHLSQHKGYGTKQHRDQITKVGSSIIHRKTYIKKENQ
jgi:ribonuclease HII